MSPEKVDEMVSLHIMAGVKAPYSQSYDEAFKVMEKVKMDGFSTRERFMKHLQNVVKRRLQETRGNIHPHFLVFFIKPADIAIASLLTMGAWVEGYS